MADSRRKTRAASPPTIDTVEVVARDDAPAPPTTSTAPIPIRNEITTDEMIRNAARIAMEAERVGEDTVTLTSGITLIVQAVSPYAIREALRRTREPEVPIIHDADKGRDEPNPNDPDYLKAMDEWVERVQETTNNVFYLLGTQLKVDSETGRPVLPSGRFGPEDDGWLRILKVLDIEIDVTDSFERYLAWLKYYAITNPEDTTRLTIAISRRSGVVEDDVAQAMSAFRYSQRRRSNLPDPSEAGSEDGD